MKKYIIKLTKSSQNKHEIRILNFQFTLMVMNDIHSDGTKTKRCKKERRKKGHAREKKIGTRLRYHEEINGMHQNLSPVYYVLLLHI